MLVDSGIQESGNEIKCQTRLELVPILVVIPQPPELGELGKGGGGGDGAKEEMTPGGWVPRREELLCDKHPHFTVLN